MRHTGLLPSILFAAAFGLGGCHVTKDPILTASPDMAVVVTPDLKTSYEGVVLIADVGGRFPVPAGDAGVFMVPGRILSTTVSFTNTIEEKIDFKDTRLIPGCRGSHYDVPGGKLPGPYLPAGVISITGYAGGMLLTGQDAPAEIQCVLNPMVNGNPMLKAYECGYGPLTMGKIGLKTSLGIYFPIATPLPPNQQVVIKGTGEDRFGSFDSTEDHLSAPPALEVVEELGKVKYSAASDTVLHFSCPADASMDGGAQRDGGASGRCPATVVLGSVIFATAPSSDPAFPGAVYGAVYCTEFAAGETITFKREALAAAIGSFSPYTTVVTQVVRGNLPPIGKTDSKGNTLTLGAGRGVIGFSTP